jgi:AsmA protein
MAKPIKIVLAVIGVLLLVVVVAVFAAAALFDPNDYRDKITETVKKQTGRTLTLGDIKLNVFPWLKVRLADVSFSNAPGFGDGPMAQVKEAQVGVQLMPLLLDRQVQVSTVTLDGLKLDLAKDASGKTNWDDLVKPKDESPEAKPKDGEGFKVESIDVAGVTLRDAFITYRDAQAKQSYRLEKVNLETGTLKPGKPTDIEASLSAFDDVKKMSADLSFSATVLADLVAQKATVDKLKLDVKAKGEGLDATAKLAGDVAANLETKVVSVEGLTLDFKTVMKDLSAEGKLVGKVLADMGAKQTVNVDGLKLDYKAKTPTIEAQGAVSGKVLAALESKQYQVSGLSLTADASGKDLPGGKQNVKLTGNLAYDGAKGSMNFTNGKIDAAGLAITTAIAGEGLSGDSPRLSGPISIAPFNPRTLLKTLGQAEIKTTDPKVLSTASLSTRYSGTFKSARFEDLKLQLDDSNISGTLAVRDFATQAIDFALKLDRIDADRYIAPAEKPVAKPAAAGSTQQLNATELPIDALEKLNASGTLDAGELKLKGATLKNVQLKIDGPKGSPKVVKLDANAYGGQISTNTRIVPGARPDYALNTSLNTMQLAPMLQNFWGKDIVSGLGNIKLNLTSGGKTVGDVRQSLNGDLSLSFENGAVKGFNLAQIVRQGQALLKGTTITDNEPKQTDFTTITFAAQIVNGILKSDQLNALSPLFRLGGSGQINLVDETLNYLVSPTIVATSKGQGGKGLEELSGLTVPIRLTGSLYAPKYKIDLQTALKQKAGDELRGKLADKVLGGDSSAPMTDAEVKQKAGEKLNKEIGRGLDKLFGGKKKKEQPAAEPSTEAAPAEAVPAPAPAEAAPAEPVKP